MSGRSRCGRRLGVVLLSLAVAHGLRAQAVDFGTDVQPILQDACLRCHRGEYTDDQGRVRRPKGGLRLDGRAWIEKGGKNGRVIVPGNAGQSPLYARTVLPADDDDRMPASGDPLSPAQTAVLKRWLDSGASFGAWVGAAGPEPVAASETPAEPTAHNQRSLDLARIAAGLAPPPAAALTRAADGKALLTPLWHGSPLLRVEFTGHEDQVTDADVASLAPLFAHIAVLVLARTEVSDAVCAHIARMRRLVRLDLRETHVTDAGLARVGALPELRALNLFGTDVSDGSVRALQALPRLDELRVWQTKLTSGAIAKLQQARPNLDLVAAPALPAAATEASPTRGRRRGK
ncbi:MAG: c-type cytochrome domain-containing protein [Planctomycetota bacterium]